MSREFHLICPLPEAAPTNVMLAHILHICRLSHQFRHLPLHIQIFFGFEVAAHQFILHAC